MSKQSINNTPGTAVEPSSHPDEPSAPSGFRIDDKPIATMDEYNEIKHAKYIIDRIIKVENGQVKAVDGNQSAYENLLILESDLTNICNPNPFGPGSRIDNFKSQPDKIKALEELRDAVSKARQDNAGFQLNPEISIPISEARYQKAIDFLNELQKVHEHKT